jgi:DNA-binding PadR family transcriptional regulator
MLYVTMLSMPGRRGRGQGESWIQLLILRIIYETPLHGYRLIDKMNNLLEGRRPIKPGSLYTILRRMEKGGLLSSNWDEKNSRIGRRVYRLNDVGLLRLKNGRQMVMGQKKIIDEMMEFYKLNFPEGVNDEN